MSESYEKKLDEFVEGKTFSRLPRPVRDRADAWCDACGSLEPRLLFGLKEEGMAGISLSVQSVSRRSASAVLSVGVSVAKVPVPLLGKR